VPAAILLAEAAAMEVLQENAVVPPLVVQFNALAAVLHEGIVSDTAAAELEVPLPDTELAFTEGAPPPSGPTVPPLMRINKPAEVVQTSPLLGTLGAAPCGMLRLEIVVVDSGSKK
jgi:hypothetical protein